MRRVLTAVAVAVISVSGWAQGGVPGWTPDRATIQRLEGAIGLGDIERLSGGGRDTSEPERVLADYARYYAGYVKEGRRMIRGEFVLGFEKKPAGVYVVPTERNFPVVMDGGCSVVNVVYDVARSRTLSVRCNGLA